MPEVTTPKPRRPPGAGALHETTAGLWRGRFVVTDPITRRKVRRYVSGRTRAEANRHLRDAMAESNRESAAVDSPTLGWWADRWLDTVAYPSFEDVKERLAALAAPG